MFTKDIAEVLVDIRDSHDWTQTRLAEELSRLEDTIITRNMVSRWEAKKGRPTYDQLRLIAQISKQHITSYVNPATLTMTEILDLISMHSSAIQLLGHQFRIRKGELLSEEPVITPERQIEEPSEQADPALVDNLKQLNENPDSYLLRLLSNITNQYPWYYSLSTNLIHASRELKELVGQPADYAPLHLEEFLADLLLSPNRQTVEDFIWTCVDEKRFVEFEMEISKVGDPLTTLRLGVHCWPHIDKDTDEVIGIYGYDRWLHG